VSGELFNFGVAFSPTDPRLHFYRFQKNGRLIYRKLVPLPYPCAVHDFSLSQRYAVFYLSPYLLDLQGLMREGRTTMESLTWQPDHGSRLLVLDRESGTLVAAVPVGRRHCLHLINAFDSGQQLTVDVLEYARPVYDQYQELPNLFQDVPPCRPVRFVLDTAGAVLSQRHELPCDYAPDFPSVAAHDERRPYRSFWTLGISCANEPGRKFFNQLVRRDWYAPHRLDVCHAPPNHYFAGQPAFLGGPACAEEGVIVCPVFDARSVATSFAFFRAFALSAGPVAIVKLKRALHLGFHCTFTPREAGLC
jgi:all-trans-8'-apo-beta-carotenal 15,15'-oxygenase